MKLLAPAKLSASPAAGEGSQELEELHEASEVCFKPSCYFGLKEHIEELNIYSDLQNEQNQDVTGWAGKGVSTCNSGGARAGHKM